MVSSKKYTPPSDFELRSGTPPLGFDSESLEDKELWLLRIPDNVNTKFLDGLHIKHPMMARKGVLAKTTIGSSTYNLVSSESTKTEFKGMAEMNVMVPDSTDGTLTLFPNSCSQLLSLVEIFDIPDSTEHATTIATRDRPQRPQPENMKMQFIPYGFYSAEEYDEMSRHGVSQNIRLSDQSSHSPPLPSASEPALKKPKTDRLQTADSVPNEDNTNADQTKEKKKRKSKDKDRTEKKSKKEKKKLKESADN
ncbi:hypothetical protein LPJ59_002380 [Coemansia sp. RSA 2399]|nr:hypothetical protein LPJ59_002380 [Coemansia sp. RSA 2399]KAJ1894382.1 hypothetical protein LPJ81_005168 [Coemansia sp. IMI 209127]